MFGAFSLTETSVAGPKVEPSVRLTRRTVAVLVPVPDLGVPHRLVRL
jgi:hypothetical protein